MTAVHVALAIYLAGALIALIRTDAGPGMRLACAVLWPIGPLAFVLTVAALVAVGMVAFPPFGVAVAALAGLAWWML